MQLCTCFYCACKRRISSICGQPIQSAAGGAYPKFNLSLKPPNFVLFRSNREGISAMQDQCNVHRERTSSFPRPSLPLLASRMIKVPVAGEQLQRASGGGWEWGTGRPKNGHSIWRWKWQLDIPRAEPTLVYGLARYVVCT